MGQGPITGTGGGGGGSGDGAPADATYWVEDANGTLTNEVVVGTTGITTATEAGKQAAAKAGRLFLPSDGFYLERDTGAAWAPWGPIFPCTEPDDDDFAWINQGTATVDTTHGGIHLEVPTSVGANLRIRKKAAPSTPYTITAQFLPQYYGTFYYHYGLCWRQSSDGKLVVAGSWKQDTTFEYWMRITKWTDPTTFGADYVFLYAARVLNFWQFSDDGANRVIRASDNGQDWLQIHSVGRTDYLTADEVGFFVNVYNQAYQGGTTLLSWAES